MVITTMSTPNFYLQYTVYREFDEDTIDTDNEQSVAPQQPFFQLPRSESGFNKKKVSLPVAKRKIPLYIVEDYTPSYRRSVIVRESATGNNGYSYDNGRKTISVTFNGELITSSSEELISYQEELQKLQGRVVELVSENDFLVHVTDNKFLIEDFTPVNSNNSKVGSKFTMTFQEYRDVDIKKSEVSNTDIPKYNEVTEDPFSFEEKATRFLEETNLSTAALNLHPILGSSIALVDSFDGEQTTVASFVRSSAEGIENVNSKFQKKMPRVANKLNAFFRTTGEGLYEEMPWLGRVMRNILEDEDS